MPKLLTDPETVLPAITALSGIGPEVIPMLTPLATNSDAEIRQRVNTAFVKFALGPQAKACASQITPVLLRNLRDENYMIRSDAAGGLPGIAGPAVAIPALLTNLQDTNAHVRAMTAQALGCFGSRSKGAVPALLGNAKDEDAFARDRAICALRQIDPEALENKFPEEDQ